MAALPSLTALRCFDASARHASFTKAAAEVHLTQGAVSHQILGMESMLGTPLFVRSRAGLQLTAAGRAYWLEVSPALRQIERATQNLATHKGEGGALKLSVSSSFGAHWLIPRLSGFIAAHPEITLNLATHVGPVDHASAGCDAAIEFCTGAAPGLRAVRVLPLVVRPYVAPSLAGLKGGRPSKAQLLRLLRTLPLIRHASVPQGWREWLRQTGLHKSLAMADLRDGPQYELVSMALNGAIAGQGIALLPDYAVAGALASGQLLRLSDDPWEADSGYYLRYPEWKADLVAIRRFEGWVRSMAAASA